MTRPTQTRIDRLYETYDVLNKKGKFIRQMTVRKSEPTPATPRMKRPCARCKMPMLVSEDQIAKYHAECRLMGRRMQKTT